jgi:hypothetical protein
MSSPQGEHAPGPHPAEPATGARGRQGDTDEAVVEHSNLPRMDKHKPEPRPVGGRIRMMDEHGQAEEPEQGRGEMPGVPRDLSPPPEPEDRERPHQQPPPARAGAADGGGYLRLQLRVDKGEITVVGVARVAGPLGPPRPMHGGLAYEVSLGDQQIGAGDVPDPGVRRGLAPPDEPERGHLVVEVPSYEFTARVPVDRLSPVNLPDLQVSVYRLDSGEVLRPSPERPLREHAGHLAEEVAVMRGIRTERLPAEVRAGLERALA